MNVENGERVKLNDCLECFCKVRKDAQIETFLRDCHYEYIIVPVVIDKFCCMKRYTKRGALVFNVEWAIDLREACLSSCNLSKSRQKTRGVLRKMLTVFFQEIIVGNVENVSP